VKVTTEDVLHIAQLAQLRFSLEELEVLRQQMESLLSHFSQISELDTTGIPPTSGVLPLVNVMRADIARPSLTVEDVLRNAPDREGDCFRIPTILEEE
jgi:aspartyl-tRNA(Asn)/glutamyl-tRNA(Gln) amidotransferase subunit C